jgi:class 3 adenylate cyclase
VKTRTEYVIGTGGICLGILLMVFFYWKSAAVNDTREHQRYVESIRHLQANDAILDQHLLRLRNGAVTSVDRVNQQLASMHRLNAILARPPEYISDKGTDLLMEILEDYKKVVGRKEVLIERFKAENANLKTSIVYFPILSQELMDSLGNSEQGGPLALLVQTLLRDVLLFNLNTNPALEITIKIMIARLDAAGEKFATSVDQSQWNPVKEFEDLRAQGYTILRVKPGVDLLIDELMAIPVAVELDNLAEEYNYWYTYAIDQASFYRLCLYFVAILTIIFLSWLIIRNLDQRIKRATQAIADQRDDLKASLENERRLTIEKQKMGAFVPKQLVDEISRSREETLALGGKVVRATIMFSDIASFTKLSERLEPQQVVDFLNLYMTEMSDIIEEEGGIIDKFIGDGIMAVFIKDDGEQSMSAVRAGLRMQAIVDAHRESWGSISPDLSQLKIRVGINTGRVISGNVGSQRRMDYTVIGDNVNVAARIEAASQPGGVLISLSTFEDISLRIQATEMDPIIVKNREQAVLTYAVEVGQDLPGS